MDTLSYKTISVNKETAKKEWVVIDATDQVVGRLCSKVAKLIRGKYKPCACDKAYKNFYQNIFHYNYNLR